MLREVGKVKTLHVGGGGSGWSSTTPRTVSSSRSSTRQQPVLTPTKRDDRWPLGYYDQLRQALDACALALGMPNFLAPVTAPDGTIITPEEQRERWRAGLDPRTGRSRSAMLADTARRAG